MDTHITPTVITDEEVGVRKIDTSRGEFRTDVSRQWFNRPDDQRFLSLTELFDHCNKRRDVSFEEPVESRQLKIRATRDNEAKLEVILPSDRTLAPTHWSFQQLCSLVGAPASYLRHQHAFRAAFNLQADLYDRGDNTALKIYGNEDDLSLRAANGPDYGRIFDVELVSAIQRFAGNGTGDTNWKVPGQIDCGNMTYNPWVDVQKDNTTLYASDRDVFVFLCDDLHPIQIGKLRDGSPDYVFRGFYAWNSEVGSRSLGLATFLMRGTCMNRCLWGVENFEELRVMHSKFGPKRFAEEAAPALERYAHSEPTAVLAGIKAAKEAKIKELEDQKKILNKDLGFSLRQTMAILETVEREEGHPAEDIWDLCQGITAVARNVPNQDNRIEMEKTAARLMNKAARNAF